MNLRKLLYRSWYYFRTGYSIYIAFFIGFLSNIIIIYSLGIQPAIRSGSSLGQILQLAFPRQTNFVVVAVAVTAPICIYIGFLHMKRTGAFAAEASVALESNPYVYKLVPGKEQEVFAPLMVLTAKGLAKVMEQQRVMTVEEKQEFDSVLSKADSLLAGNVIGVPRQGISRIPRIPEKKADGS